MRITILILMVQLTFFSLIGQSAKKINIHINSNNGNCLPLSHVIVDKETHLIADEEGSITFSTLRGKSKYQNLSYRISINRYNHKCVCSEPLRFHINC